MPVFGVSTAAVYRQVRSLTASAEPVTVLLDNVKSGKGLHVQAGLQNDLESPARVVEPRLEELWQATSAAGIEGLRMSGSGSTCFLAFRSKAAADDAEARLKMALAAIGVRVLGTRSIGASEWRRPPRSMEECN
jgi:4-diphosphocytidyl-2C-methyl-D-erythritol kinase